MARQARTHHAGAIIKRTRNGGGDVSMGEAAVESDSDQAPCAWGGSFDPRRTIQTPFFELCRNAAVRERCGGGTRWEPSE